MSLWSRRRRDMTWVAVSLLVMGLLAGAVLTWRGMTEQPEAAPLPSTTFGSLGLGDAPAGSSPSSGTAETLTRAQQGQLKALRAATYRPNRLIVPALQIDAPVTDEPARGGDLVIPGDPQIVGRWADSAPVGAPAGTTLLAGHVSVAGVGDGALHRLHEVTPKTFVVTTDSRGRPQIWQVGALSVVPKTQLPRIEAAGARRLLLVTCGGELVGTDNGNSFADNVIATAVPVPAV